MNEYNIAQEGEVRRNSWEGGWELCESSDDSAAFCDQVRIFTVLMLKKFE
jgi:hypothetical protein